MIINDLYNNNAPVLTEGMKAQELAMYCEKLVAEKGLDAAYKHALMMANVGRDPAWNGVLKYLDAMKDGMSEGRMVKGPGGVPLDRQGRPVPPKVKPIGMQKWLVTHSGSHGEGGKDIIEAPNFETAWEIANEYDLDIIDVKPYTGPAGPTLVDEGVAEGVTPASTSKVLRLIDRHNPEWFEDYGMGEVEDTVVELAERGEFQGMSAVDAMALVHQELEKYYGHDREQGMTEGKNTNPRVNEIRQLAKDFFGYNPYSSGTIQGGKILRLSFPFNRSLSTFYHSVPLTRVSPQDQQLLKKLKSDFEQFMASNGVSADEVSMKFHTGAGVYASVRIVIPQEQGVVEGYDSEELANEVYAEFERIYPNLARKANERTVHAAVMDVLNYGGDSNPSALAQDVARTVKRDIQQGVAEGSGPKRFKVTYKLQNGEVKEKIMIGKDANAVAKYFEFKYRHKPVSVVEQGVAEVSDKTLVSYLSKVSDDSLKHDQDPTKRSAEKRNRSVTGFARAFNKLDGRKPDGSIKENDSDVPVHRIGLTVIDPQHPMVSKRREEYQKTVRVPGHDREQAITAAINHLRRRGFKVLDHHYLGVAEQPNEGQYGVAKKPQPYHDPDWWKKLPKDQLDALAGKRYPKDKKPTKPVSEVSLGDYRKKAAVSKATSQMDRFFGRDDPAAVAAADQTIAKRERGLSRADTRAAAYTPPAAAPMDLEKQRRDLTAKYPNIDELVRRAELNRDPNYERADGQAYYAARDAEHNYLKLKQIQRVIQGLNESLDRSHLP